MKLKRIAALLLALVMVFALVACTGNNNDTKTNTDGSKAPDQTQQGNNNTETYELKLKLWVPEAAVELTKKQIEDFNKSNTDGIKVIPEIDPISESEMATQVLNDVTQAADMYFFAQDQFARLVRGGALSEIPAEMVSIIEAENDADVVSAGKSGSTQYAYPLTNDNGYFMYYDKSIIPEEDLDSMEKLIADCENAKKYFAFEQDTSAWYNASFFFGAGCHSNWVVDDDGKVVGVDDDFDSDKGLIAVKGMEKLVKSDYFLSSSQAGEFSRDAAIVVSGPWAYTDVQAILGDNLGATDLPSFEVDGTEYHLGSFRGCKLLGVKPQTDADRQAAMHLLAQYLTSESAQMERFNTLAWGPANTKAAADPAVLANPALTALKLQQPYAVKQDQIDGSWWDIAKVISTEVKEAKSEADLKAALSNYSAKIYAIFEKTDAQKNAWSVIGMYNEADGFFFTDYNNETRSNWADDLPMVDAGNGVFKTAEAYELPEGCEFKCRQGGSWDVAYPAENFKVETAGTYYIVLNTADGTVSLEAK